MPFQGTSSMDEKVKFVAACLADEETMTALCVRFGISRKTGYKWLERYRVAGPQGLEELPRAPLEHGRATPCEIVAALVAEKEANPLWGPKKLVARLVRRVPGVAWPAVSTAGEILKRHGLVRPRKRGRLKASGNGPWPVATAANEVWTADHKGWFRTRDGKRCEPLTVIDRASRYGLGLVALNSTAEAEAWPVFERLFGLHGLPLALRSDNGPPFAGGGVTGLSALSVKFVKLGIELQRIDPGKPQQNGSHERFHGTMLPLEVKPEADLASQQLAFNAFLAEYNVERPHEALGQTPPADHWSPSPRPLPARFPEPDYPAEAAVRRVRSTGEIKWRGQLVHMSTALTGELVAIEETEDSAAQVRFHNHILGTIDEVHAKLRRSRVAHMGHPAPPPSPPEV